jgi:hypothetical protein
VKTFHRIGFSEGQRGSYLKKSLDRNTTDPADPSVTKRVITIMLAEEY